ncbi:hypothetical protein A2115_00565 [Candidatus Woesebacteria bacterium GWA1_41_8]|uniref:DUF5659 domain-containing protein n=1 Tax=Candidatus Woesebacteria bacterium GWA1_41_8 TaxID=1802471 RepID=A0A1F7WKI8_9BACT|nr:MAG: hypothetical protein A2115_00565 [Candidatus Woesebacteria bacterium GWA1_41_8]
MLQQNNTPLFTTKDLYISALCYAKGMKLERIEREGRVCWFVFVDKKRGEQLQQDFITKTVEVNAKDYSDALRTLKDLLFAHG